MTLRIAIVNDLPIAIEALKRIVESVQRYEVAWIAKDGAEAVEMCRQDLPDLILMDMIMPVMDGIESTRQIMKETPCAILIVTASVGANAAKVFEAMGHGALDVVKTPTLGGEGGQWGVQQLLAKIDVIARLIGRGRPALSKKVGTPSEEGRLASVRSLIVIGSSTGGPKALARLLSRLPKNFPAALVIIQHVDQHFAGGLAAWLSKQTPLDVEVAVAGTPVVEGTVLIASTDDHLVMTPDLTLDYTSDPKEAPYRPSVDVFFESVATHWPKEGVRNSAALLLTGMGRDGAEGMQSLWERGWHTIAEDASSCVVYGMPKAAVKMGVVKEILPIDDIGDALIQFVEKGKDYE